MLLESKKVHTQGDIPMPNYTHVLYDDDRSLYVEPPAQIGKQFDTIRVQGLTISSSGGRGIFCWDSSGMIDVRSCFDVLSSEEDHQDMLNRLLKYTK